MITLVRLTNWRAYGDVEVQLERGTTFLIGMNGVGKTSFLEAVRWAFDQGTKGDPEFIRKGQRTAAVDVTLALESGTARIRRLVSLGDKPTPLKTPTVKRQVWIDGNEVTDEKEFFDRLEQAWGADIGFVTRTAFLDADVTGPAVRNELRAHLCRAYNLDAIEENVRVLDGEIKKAVKEAEAEYKAGEDLDRQISETEGQLSEQEFLLRGSDSRSADLELALEAATAALLQAQTAQAALDAQKQWDAGWAALADACGDLVGQVTPGTDLRSLLQVALTAATLRLDEARDANARLRERISALEGALATLAAAEGDCPVCRRSLDDVSRAHAHAVQQADLDRAAHDLHDVALVDTTSVVNNIEGLLDRAKRLGDRPDAPVDESADVAAARAVVDELQRQRDDLIGERGGTSARIGAAKVQLLELKRQQAAAAEAPAAYRRVGVLTASRDALRATVTEVLSAQMGPIGQEISARWDGVFPDRPGLMVDPDGELSRPVAGGTLAYPSFSAGEKTVARLLLKLATVISTTKVPFCWIDEPLEHLDDKSRLIIARTLAQFGKQGVLDQIFVTTYEQSLASVVAQSSDSPRIEYLGTSQVAS